MKFICTCQGAKYGNYKNQELLRIPWTGQKKRFAGIDRCIIPLIMSLWSQGIRTIESCCGHGVNDTGYIATDHDSIAKMELLGFGEHKDIPGVFEFPIVSATSE